MDCNEATKKLENFRKESSVIIEYSASAFDEEETYLLLWGKRLWYENHFNFRIFSENKEWKQDVKYEYKQWWTMVKSSNRKASPVMILKVCSKKWAQNLKAIIEVT